MISDGIRRLYPPERRLRADDVPESLIQDIWGRREYDHRHLETVTGRTVLVLHTGRPNRDSGPDFLAARIQIGRTEWVGDVEIHRSSSEWLQHRHDRDVRYNSVVLHVVLTADLWTGRLHREDSTCLPEVVLSGFLSRSLRKLIVSLRGATAGALPCRKSWPRLSAAAVGTYVAGMSEARLVRRSEFARDAVGRTGSPDQVLYTRVLAALGYSKNQDPMQDLGARVPIAVLRRVRERRDVEALLLGAASLIPTDDRVEGSDADRRYVRELRVRADQLSDLYSRNPAGRTQWRFFRLRPSNFPPIRLAQAAALVSDGLLSRPDAVQHLADIITGTGNPLRVLRAEFAVSLQGIWVNHVRLERPARGGPFSLGKGRIDHVILNAVLPMLEYHADRTATDSLRTAVRRAMRLLPFEDDEVTRQFAGLGIDFDTAEISQGLHEIHGRLCMEQGCLRCCVGRTILSAK